VDTPQSREVVGGAAELVEGEPAALAAGIRRATLGAGGSLKIRGKAAAECFRETLQTARMLDVYAELREAQPALAG